MYEEIWLQCPNLDSMSEWYGEVTWCQDQQNDDDTKYVRADLFASIEKQRDDLLAEFAAYKEGSEEAFGAVVAQKQAAEARLQTMQSTIASQQGVICDFREQRDELLAALTKLSGMKLNMIADGIVDKAIARVKG